jgi:hydroxyacylglutathione hydrolase
MIGKKRRFNYALQAGSSEEFIRLLTDSLPVPNIQQPVELNCHGATSIDSLPHPATLSSGEFCACNPRCNRCPGIRTTSLSPNYG